MHQISALVGCMLFSTTTIYAASCADKPLSPDFFGIHNHRFHATNLQPTVNFPLWRLWDAGVMWRDLEKDHGMWDFTRLDIAVNLAETKKIELILTLGGTPAWAAAPASSKGAYGIGSNDPPNDMRDWIKYIESVAHRYKGRIKYYEIWNEPNEKIFFSGSVFELVAMQKYAIAVLRNIDPAAKIISASPSKKEALSWFEDYVASGGVDEVDIVGYHFWDAETSEEISMLSKEIQRITRKVNRSHIPIWNTEQGISTLDQSHSIPPELRIHSIARLLQCNGIEKLIYYSWDHATYGFVDPSNRRSLMDISKFASGFLQK